MAKVRKISTSEFEFLVKMKPFVLSGDKEAKKNIKYELLNAIKRVFGDKWFNLNQKTKQSIDYICFLSVEKGFFYASPEHIAKKSGVGKSTVYHALKILRESGVLFKVNRTSKKQNGLGCAVHFFVQHPYFCQYNSFLKLNWKAEQKTDWKPKERESLYQSRENEEKITSTYQLPNQDHENIDLQLNAYTSINTIIKYVPKEINKLYAGIFGFRLRNIWVKIIQAYKATNQSNLNRDQLINIGIKIIRRIVQLLKKRIDMSIDEMCAFAYKSAMVLLDGNIKELHKKIYVNKNEKIKKGDYIKSPEWVDEINKKREFCKKQIEEAKRDIPYLEKEFIKKNVVWKFNQLFDYVMKTIKERYKELDRNDLIEIEDCYGELTTQKYAYQEYCNRSIEETLQKIKMMNGGI